MTTKRCVSWIAVSSKPQADKASPTVQAEANEAFVEAMPDRYDVDGVIIETLHVVGSRSIIELSEAEATYPAYKSLARMIRNADFDILLVYTDDRLGRNHALIMTIRELCIDSGILIVETSDPPPASLDVTESEGEKYVSAFKAVRSRNEILRLVDRRRVGMHRRVAEGLLFPGRVPFGYAYEYDRNGNRQIVIDEMAAPTVRRILIDLYLGCGHGAPAICQILNDEGALPPELGDRWTTGSVQDIIKRAERYAGILEYNKRSAHKYQRVEAKYPPIITKDEFRQVLAQRTKRSRTNHRNRPLSGICICGYCGRTMVYQTRYLASGPAPVMQCRNRDCEHRLGRTYESEIIDTLRQALAELPDDPEAQEYILGEYDNDDFNVTIAQAEDEVKKLLADRRRKERARQRANKAYIELESLSEIEYLETLREIEDQIREIDEQIADVEEQIESGQAEADKIDRIEEARENGLAMMELVDDEPGIFNSWLRELIRIHIWRNAEPGGMYEFEIV